MVPTKKKSEYVPNGGRSRGPNLNGRSVGVEMGGGEKAAVSGDFTSENTCNDENPMMQKGKSEKEQAKINSELTADGGRSRGPNRKWRSVGASIGGGEGTAVVNSGNSETSSDNKNATKPKGRSKKKPKENEDKIRIGCDHQAICPPFIPVNERNPNDLDDRAVLIWKPNAEIPDEQLDQYITLAKEKHRYGCEQALGLLIWHNYDFERAVADLTNFKPVPDEWTNLDKRLFEEGLKAHGKRFELIKNLLPDKSIPNLIQYYYLWKKSRFRQTVIDQRQNVKISKKFSRI